MLMSRHDFTLVESGHVMLAVSIATILAPPLFGLLAVSDRARRFWIIGMAIVYVAVFLMLAFTAQAMIDIALAILAGILTGFTVLQYADVRAAYSEAIAGRALAVFTMAVFLGVALMQWLTGLAASLATAQSADPLTAAFLVIAGLLAAATAAFILLPWPCFTR